MRRLFVVALCLVPPLAAFARPFRGRAHGTPHRAASKHTMAPPRNPSRASAESVARLGRGARLVESIDYAAAQKELAPLAGVKLLNRDLALYLLAESEALSGSPEPALVHFKKVAAMQQSRWAGVARARSADMAFELGRVGEARSEYVAVLKSPSPAVEPAVALFRLGELAARDPKRKREALAAFRKVWSEHPVHPLAERALLEMKALDPSVEVSPSERVERARRLSGARKWKEALDELSLVPADAPAQIRDNADYWTATTRFKMRHDYERAAAELLSVAERLSGDRKTEALFLGARAYSRADAEDDPAGARSQTLTDKAIAGYRDLIARFPHCRQASEASFLIGWLAYNRARYPEALMAFEETIRRYPGTPHADDARWYHGLSRWFSGDAKGALADFEIVGRRGGALEGGKGRYWKGRALDQLGSKPEAVTVWRAIVAEFPFTYYALQARARLSERGAPVGPFGGAMSHPVPPLGEVDERLAADPVIARADELLAAGLTFEAGEALDAGGGDLIKRYGAARALPILLDRLVKSEDFFRAHRLAESHSAGALQFDPWEQPSAAAWWRHVDPLAWRALVEKYGKTGKNPTYYLYTIMQKESAYNPHDVSYADAIGLLQMIPPTSRRVAERIGRPYTDDVLYDPEGNIQFGAWYIGNLLQKFKGQIALGAGSFNAGPKAMMKWVKQHGDRPLDEFIELCPYTQTREYMKKALDIYARYLYLYDRRDYLPEAAIDTKFLDDGLDY